MPFRLELSREGAPVGPVSPLSPAGAWLLDARQVVTEAVPCLVAPVLVAQYARTTSAVAFAVADLERRPSAEA